MLKDKADSTEEAEKIQLVTFFLGTEEYALDIFDVKEVVRKPKVTPIPNSPRFIKGIIDLRGEVIPILDLKRHFNLPPDKEEETYVIIIREKKKGKGETELFGILADKELQIISFPADKIEKTPESFKANINPEFLKGIAVWQEKIFVILEPEGLLKDEHREKIKRADLGKN